MNSLSSSAETFGCTGQLLGTRPRIPGFPACIAHPQGTEIGAAGFKRMGGNAQRRHYPCLWPGRASSINCIASAQVDLDQARKQLRRAITLRVPDLLQHGPRPAPPTLPSAGLHQGAAAQPAVFRPGCDTSAVSVAEASGTDSQRREIATSSLRANGLPR